MIKKEETIVVPKGIRYLSDWKEFSLVNFPKKFILDKQIPGCGFTNYCLTSPENIVLCSPRKILLENKAEKKEFINEVYLVVNEASLESNIDKDLIKKPCVTDIIEPLNYMIKVEKLVQEIDGERIDDTRKRISQALVVKEKGVYRRLLAEIKEYVDRRLREGKPIKILVTYDSYRLVRSILNEIHFSQVYYTVVDEYQSALQDATFKADVEVEFFSQLDMSERVCFVSATPMMEEYMNMLDEFDGLPYYELDWASDDPSRIVKPDLKVLTMTSVGNAANPIVQSYLDGKFEKTYKRDKDTGEIIEVESKEAVFYVNSLTQVMRIIKKNNLQPHQVNIICARTKGNKSRLRNKLGGRYHIGRIPKEDEPNKMFTICTRTAYLGADFYSSCARTFIFSDSNIKSLAVDIAEDLPQIMGRQRSDENPWSNSATFYYRIIAERQKMTQESLNELIETKKETTALLLSAYDHIQGGKERDVIKSNYRKVAESYNYKDDYVSIKNGVPVLNKFVLVNEIRAFRIQQIDYRDRVSVFAKINKVLDPATKGDYSNDNIVEFLEEYSKLTSYYDKMKMLCNSTLSDEAMEIILNQIPNKDNIKVHFTVLGKERCKALGYNSTYIPRELEKLASDHTDMINEIINSFEVGKRYLLSYVKSKLIEIYKKYSYSEKPLAKDLEEYFETDSCYVTVEDLKTGKKKQQRAYKIIKKK